MPIVEDLYALSLHLARPLLHLAARGDGKLATGLRGRRGVLERIERWAADERDPRRSLVWFHAPSVGEGLQARAVLDAFSELHPEAQSVYTFFSPSAEALARSLAVDFADYLPLDLPRHVGRALDAIRPDILVFSKSDVWPNLTREASRRGIPMALLSATLPAGSSRLRVPARALLGPAYRRLNRIAGISAEDAERFGAFGVPAERRSVMGDARFDQVWRRAAEVDRDAPWYAGIRRDPATVLVAGSVWPEDEERLIPAFRAFRCEDSAAHRLVLVPHEPTPAGLIASESRLRTAGIGSVRWSEIHDWQAPLPEAVLVDRVGILGDLYAAADLAYVGGGWGSAGIHSVLEPAAFGVPVLFGPRHGNAREASELIAAGGGFSATDAAELAGRLSAWGTNVDSRAVAGGAARAYVERNRGASARGAAIVDELLGR